MSRWLPLDRRDVRQCLRRQALAANQIAAVKLQNMQRQMNQGQLRTELVAVRAAKTSRPHNVPGFRKRE